MKRLILFLALAVCLNAQTVAPVPGVFSLTAGGGGGGGGGTVTSVTSANGAISVANPTTAAVLTLNAISLSSSGSGGVTGTLPVANGGTGLSTTTAYSVLFSGTTATGNFNAAIGPGTSGQVLTSNGAGAYPTWQAAGGGGTNVTAASAASGSGLIWQSAGADRSAVASNTLGTIGVTTANVTTLNLASALQLFSDPAPTTSTAGAMAFDNNAWASGRGAVQVYDGTANTYLVGVLASSTPTNGQVPQWNTGGTITWVTPAGGGNVSNSGTPTSGQIAEWTNSTTIQGVAVTGTGSVVRAASPTLTGTLSGAAATFSGLVSASNVLMAPTTLTYSGTTNLDFAAIDGKKIITVTGNITFTTSNLVSGKSVRIKIVASGGPWTFTFPGGWTFIGAAAPASIASGKTAVLTLDSDTTADSGVVAAYAVQP